jgi:hypothetical protein
MEAVCSSKTKVNFYQIMWCHISEDSTIHIVTFISVAREQLGKHIPVKKNSWPAIGKGLSIARQ